MLHNKALRQNSYACQKMFTGITIWSTTTLQTTSHYTNIQTFPYNATERYKPLQRYKSLHQHTDLSIQSLQTTTTLQTTTPTYRPFHTTLQTTTLQTTTPTYRPFHTIITNHYKPLHQHTDLSIQRYRKKYCCSGLAVCSVDSKTLQQILTPKP